MCLITHITPTEKMAIVCKSNKWENRINKKKEKTNNENLFFDFFVIYLETVKKLEITHEIINLKPNRAYELS